MAKTGLPAHPACPGWGSLCLQHPGSALLGAQAGRPRSVAAGRTSAFLHRDDPFLPAPGRGGLRRGSRVPPASPHPPPPLPCGHPSDLPTSPRFVVFGAGLLFLAPRLVNF